MPVMAVLVTGGAGYIGSHMVLALVDAGEEVVVLDDLSSGFARAVHPKARLVQGDVADEALVLRRSLASFIFSPGPPMRCRQRFPR